MSVCRTSRRAVYPSSRQLLALASNGALDTCGGSYYHESVGTRGRHVGSAERTAQETL